MSQPSPQSRLIFGLPKLPARSASIVMPLLLSFCMTFIVSMISTLRGIGWVPDFLTTWLAAWGWSWLIAFPALLLLLPVARRITACLVVKV